MHEAVFKNRFRHRAGAFGHQIERHELRLHVGGKAGVFGGAKALRLQGAFAANAHAALLGQHLGPGLLQLVDHGPQVVGAGIAQKGLAPRGGHGAQKGARFNAVGHHLVLAAVQLLHPVDDDAAGAVASDFCAHADEHFRQIGDFGLHGGVFQHRAPFGQAGGHEEIFGAGHRHHVGADVRPAQALLPQRQAGQHVAVIDGDFRTHGLQAFDVLIDRARANGAAAGQRHLGAAKAGQQRPQHQHRGAHGFHQLIRRFGVQRIGGGKAHAAALAVGFGGHAHVVEQAAHGGHVVQARHVHQVHRLRGEQGGTHLRQGGVFGARDQDFALQALPTTDEEFVHF